MFDSHLRIPIDRFAGMIAPVLRRLPLRANLVTLFGVLLVPVIMILLVYGEFLIAMGVILLNRILDGLDGMVARLHGATDFGGYSDIVADFVFYASIPVAFALYDPANNALASVFLLASFIASSSSFLAYAIIAAKRGLETSARGKKSFFHLGGLIEGAETILFCLLICLLPDYYAGLAFGFAVLCGISSFGRILFAYRDFCD